ncbi:TIGR02677 family protein [Nocardia rosealba]|uniref:TIGR02677 family protein n=1 Tax=Nocardia rosealba TaxID=2878563 RepID=UPI001CD960FD|nr:TIGR02677 family protein [Nocardia rosealba]MCA2210582.1 TIGR02677 family protein [Nocardia rosealba]
MDPIRVPADMFRFTTVDRSGLYMAVLQAFGEANERLETALSLDDLRRRLDAVGFVEAIADDDLAASLERMRQWNLIDVVQNHSENYRTALDYERRNLLYSLTKQGEAAFAGVVHAISVLTSSGALQTAVLDAIGDRLADLVRELDSGSDKRIFTVAFELESHLEGLRTNTKQFNGELQRLLRAEGVDLAVFHEVKAATVAYLQEFLNDIDRRSHVIANRIQAVEDFGVSRMHQRALRGAELPTLGGTDPAPAWLEQRRARWEGLRAWFLPIDDSPPRIDQLRQVGRRAIITLLQVLDRLTESRRRASSAVADFRELARWFTVLPEEDDLHRLWSTAFGLGSARHAHLTHPDPELVSYSASWASAPPVEVSPLLRSAGRTERMGRTGSVPDVSALRKERAVKAAAERAELLAAWDLLDTGGQTRTLGQFVDLDHAMFERLLDLLGRALGAAPDSAGVRRSMTSDGRVEISLSAGDPGAIAELRTPRGVFRGPDYRVRIRTVGSRRS